MWEIFLAVFGGIYWACKFGSERKASLEVDKALSEMALQANVWDNTVVDSALESRIKSDLRSRITFDKLKGDAIKLIRSFHGLQYADFNMHYDAKYKDYYVRRMVEYIALVKCGKLPALQTKEIPNYLELSLDIKPSKRSRIEFAKWIEHTMKSHGVKNAAIYYTGIDYASFSWAPYVYCPAKSVSIHEPSLESRMAGIGTEETDSQNRVIIERKQKAKSRA